MTAHTRWVTLNRDCEALLIPSGMPFMVPGGTGVEITQAKGSAITIHINGQLARVESKDADALGVEFSTLVKETSVDRDNVTADGPVDIDKVWDELKTCYDPEIPVNIVDLGLIYDCRIESNTDNTQNTVYITMTLTAAGCGMGPVIVQDVENSAWRVKNVTNVFVEMVFEPPWSRDMISDAAKLELGLF